MELEPATTGGDESADLGNQNVDGTSEVNGTSNASTTKSVSTDRRRDARKRGGENSGEPQRARKRQRKRIITPSASPPPHHDHEHTSTSFAQTSRFSPLSDALSSSNNTGEISELVFTTSPPLKGM
ncbi:hypothetical protein K402DRAFT_393212 [Aulographum hederae CBS 113979]|uniref:Uncharacterized protein n=1 Tax=Aulographum hederae CBS 113979 TaxID=1176131 RepID=A0A6G1H1K4_9PEZI|nr:hypothetical protein K402DRAFT_393212 [Aulographum hederae CBS 113979]